MKKRELKLAEAVARECESQAWQCLLDGINLLPEPHRQHLQNDADIFRLARINSTRARLALLTREAFWAGIVFWIAVVSGVIWLVLKVIG